MYFVRTVFLNVVKSVLILKITKWQILPEALDIAERGKVKTLILQMGHEFAVYTDFSPVILKLELVSRTYGGLVKTWAAITLHHMSPEFWFSGGARDFVQPPSSQGLLLQVWNSLRTAALVPFCGIRTLELNTKGKV